MELAVILDAAATGGQRAIVEITAKRGDGSPVHVHSPEQSTVNRRSSIHRPLQDSQTVQDPDAMFQLTPSHDS